MCIFSHSGALGPLLHHVRSSAGDDARARSALQTLGLLVSNLPNRDIASELHGCEALIHVLRNAKALDVREKAVCLLWDLKPQCDSKVSRWIDIEPSIDHSYGIVWYIFLLVLTLWFWL